MSTPSRVSMAAAAACSAARLERPTPSAGSELRHIDGDAEIRIVVRAGALHLAVDRRRQAAPLRPFLQHGFRIAQRMLRFEHALLPQPLDHCRRRRIAAIDEHRADQAPRTHRQGSRCAAVRPRSAPNCRAARPRRDRSRAPHRRSFRAAPDRRAGARVRPRRPSGTRDTACPRWPSRARGRREIRAADSFRRAPAWARPPKCG